MAATAPSTLPARIPLWRTTLSMFTNPQAVFQSQLTAVPAPLCLLVSGLAFALFYLQTGLDLGKRDLPGIAHALDLGALGFAVGTLGVGLLAVGGWVLARPFGGSQPLGWAVRAFGLAYSPALLYALLGLCANLLLGWNTSLAFGVTGVLWALGPMLVAIREMAGQRTGVAVFIATICGAFTLAGWALIVR